MFTPQIKASLLGSCLVPLVVHINSTMPHDIYSQIYSIDINDLVDTTTGIVIFRFGPFHQRFVGKLTMPHDRDSINICWLYSGFKFSLS